MQLYTKPSLTLAQPQPFLQVSLIWPFYLHASLFFLYIHAP